MLIDAGVCSAGLRTIGVAGGEGRCELPGRHQDREVPRDDLADDAERLVEVVGDGVVVDLATAMPSCARMRAREVAEVVDRQRDVGGHRLADRLAVVPRLGDREQLEVLLHPVGDLVQDDRALVDRLVLPQAGAAACAASSASSMSSAVERAISVNTSPVTGEGFSKYWPLTGGRTRRR